MSLTGLNDQFIDDITDVDVEDIDYFDDIEDIDDIDRITDMNEMLATTSAADGTDAADQVVTDLLEFADERDYCLRNRFHDNSHTIDGHHSRQYNAIECQLNVDLINQFMKPTDISKILSIIDDSNDQTIDETSMDGPNDRAINDSDLNSNNNSLNSSTSVGRNLTPKSKLKSKTKRKTRPECSGKQLRYLFQQYGQRVLADRRVTATNGSQSSGQLSPTPICTRSKSNCVQRVVTNGTEPVSDLSTIKSSDSGSQSQSKMTRIKDYTGKPKSANNQTIKKTISGQNNTGGNVKANGSQSLNKLQSFGTKSLSGHSKARKVSTPSPSTPSVTARTAKEVFEPIVKVMNNKKTYVCLRPLNTSGDSLLAKRPVHLSDHNKNSLKCRSNKSIENNGHKTSVQVLRQLSPKSSPNTSTNSSNNNRPVITVKKSNNRLSSSCNTNTVSGYCRSSSCSSTSAMNKLLDAIKVHKKTIFKGNKVHVYTTNNWDQSIGLKVGPIWTKTIKKSRKP